MTIDDVDESINKLKFRIDEHKYTYAYAGSAANEWN